MIILLATSSIWSADLTISEYSSADIRVSPDGRRIAADGHATVGLGGGIEICAVTYVAGLAPDQQLSDLQIGSQDSVRLAYRLPDGHADYLATADSMPYHDLVSPSAQLEQLGRHSVILSEKAENGRRWAVVTVFPVTVGADGELYLHRRITARSTADEMFTIPPIPAAQYYSQTKEPSGRSALAGAPNYLIVTSSELDGSMLELADYRRAVGYNVETALIDDIVAGWSGRDDAERLRNYLSEYYNQGGEFVLLAGDETQLPVRYVYHYSTSVMPDFYQLQLCDLYFAEVEADWDPDNDNIFGERDISLAEVTPQLRVGRLPFSSASEADAYVRKLIAYESNPGNGSFEYLNRAFFYTSDQMRDLGTNGQHGAIAEVYPDAFAVDTVSGVESATGDDPMPDNPNALASLDSLATGFGIVNILAHGRSDAFGVTTANYNNWPKSYFITEEVGAPHGDCRLLPADNRVGLYYSLACDNGGFDQDQPPLNRSGMNLAQQLLALDSAGAIGFVGYSRWGWVGSSYLQQRAFFEELFAGPDGLAVDAMNRAKERYYYYRDMVYGQNFLGDPALTVWTDTPKPLELVLSAGSEGEFVVARSNGVPVAGCTVRLSDEAGLVQAGVTDESGHMVLAAPLDPDVEYILAGDVDGHVNGYRKIRSTFSTDIQDEHYTLPSEYALQQNYPNPFNPSTSIVFSLPRRSDVSLVVYNVLGREVARLVDQSYPAGEHHVTWDATDYNGSSVASGVYLYRLESNLGMETKKMLLLR